MLKGIIFDIRELAVHDGPGLRTTVFLKGCPLRCSWCHNPEGISPEIQTITSSTGNRTIGKWYTSDELASLLNKQADILRNTGGGVTFSGGEPLRQAAFVAEVIEQLNQIHVVLDTSGFGTEEDFRMLVERVDLVLFDLKLIDAEKHRRFTGCENSPILRNFELLNRLSKPYIVRVPLVPGVTDTEENLSAIAELVKGRKNLEYVELLPYNRAAGGKYAPLQMVFQPGYDEMQPVTPRPQLFEQRGIRVKVS